MALLPNADEAVIAAEKLRDYLLNLGHPANGGKASFFLMLGYSRDDWVRLEEDLREQHLTQDALEVSGNAYGRKWTIEAELKGPEGTGRILSVWFAESGNPAPRFVTARPIESKR